MKAIIIQNRSNTKLLTAMLLMLLFLCTSSNIFAKTTENINPTEQNTLTAAELDQSDILTVDTDVLFSVSIPKGEYIRFSIFDVNGRELKVLIDDNKAQGDVVVDLSKADLKNGTYYYRLVVGKYKEVKKMNYSK